MYMPTSIFCTVCCRLCLTTSNKRIWWWWCCMISWWPHRHTNDPAEPVVRFYSCHLTCVWPITIAHFRSWYNKRQVSHIADSSTHTADSCSGSVQPSSLRSVISADCCITAKSGNAYNTWCLNNISGFDDSITSSNRVRVGQIWDAIWNTVYNLSAILTPN